MSIKSVFACVLIGIIGIPLMLGTIIGMITYPGKSEIQIGPAFIELDPEEVEYKISSDQAIQIIEKAGYAHENFSVKLVREEGLRENLCWLVEWVEKGQILILVDANEGRIVEIVDLSTYEFEPKVVTESNAVEIAEEKIKELTRIPAELGTPEVSVRENPLETIFGVEWLQETDTYGRECIYVELDPSGNLITFVDTWRG